MNEVKMFDLVVGDKFTKEGFESEVYEVVTAGTFSTKSMAKLIESDEEDQIGETTSFKWDEVVIKL